MDRRVAKRYAAAIFNVAVKNDAVRVVENDLKLIVTAVFGDNSVRDFLLSPRAPRDVKHDFLMRALKGKVDPLTLDTIGLLLKKRREDEIPFIADEYETLRRVHEKVLYVKVTSSIELTDLQRKALIDKLARKLGKTLEPEFAVDTTLIGGVRVAYENMVLDGSIRGGLNRLDSILHHDVLKQA